MLLLGISVIESGKEIIPGVVSFGGFVDSGSTGWKLLVDGPSSISYSIVESVSVSVVAIVVTGGVGVDVVDGSAVGDVFDVSLLVGRSVVIEDDGIGTGTGSTNLG